MVNVKRKPNPRFQQEEFCVLHCLCVKIFSPKVGPPFVSTHLDNLLLRFLNLPQL